MRVGEWVIEATLGSIGQATWALAVRPSPGSVYRGVSPYTPQPVDRGLLVVGPETPDRLMTLAFEEASIVRRFPGHPFQELLALASSPIPYCVFERKHATPVRRWLDAGEPWPLGAVASLGIALCDALARLHAASAHDGSSLHACARPTPDTLWVTAAGELRIANLALANWLASTCEEGSRKPETRRLDHAAPEILMGSGATAASDVFAVGVLLLGLASGRPLFVGGDVASIIRDILQARLPVDAFAQVPPRLRAVLSRTVDADPSKREQSAGALGEQIGRACASDGVGLAPLPASSGRRPLSLVGVPRSFW
jgi:serine/threonine protein kinase